MASARNFKPLNPGDMRFVGTIEQAIQGVDTAGSPLVNYQTFADGVRFGFADYRGNENVVGNTILSSIVTYLVVRWRPGLEGVQPNVLRMKHATDVSVSPPIFDYYDIQSVIRDRTMKWAVQMQCIRRDSAGYRTGRPT